LDKHGNKSESVLSIIVVTWNGKKYALECLESLTSKPFRFAVEIIVVDNGSTDGTPKAIRTEFPDFRLIENHANLGFARANNIGMASSSGKYVCLVNSDVVIPAGCLEKMVEYMESHPKIGVLGPKMLSPDGGVGASVMRLPTVWNTLCCALGLHTIFPRSELLGGFLMDAYPYDSIEEVEVLTGWFWMIPRTALNMVGGLDERFFMYGEDIDWCHRFRDAGWQVVFYPDADALHYGAASSQEAPSRFYVEMRRANLQYFRKHHGVLGVFGYQFAIWVHEISRVFGYSVLYCFSRQRRSESAIKIQRSILCIRWMLGDRSFLATPPRCSEPAERVAV
jgi:GT2 family glycosyltransferase